MGRKMSFIYGSVAYAIFFACFLYAIGFVGNIVVPKSIDSGETEPFGPSLLINTALLGLFALQPGMARKGFKQWWTKTVPTQIERSTYVLFTCIALTLIFWQWRPMPEVVWSVENPAGRAALQALSGMGWLIMFVSTIMIHHFDLFGMRQVWLHLQGKPHTELGFRTPGFYRYLRHPIQAGFLIAFWVTPTMTVGHLLFSLATTGYILIAVKFFEEPDLLSVFGDRYRRYMDQVSGFLPVRRYRGAEATAVRLEKAAGATSGN